MIAVPQSGPHQYQDVVPGEGLERDLVGQHQIVAEHHDVEAQAKGLHRLCRCMGAGTRDQGEIGLGIFPQGHFKGDRRGGPVQFPAPIGRRPVLKAVLGEFEGIVQRLIALGADGNEHVVGAGVDGSVDQARGPGKLPVAGRGHYDRCLTDAGHPFQFRRHLDEGDRVPVNVFQYLLSPDHLDLVVPAVRPIPRDRRWR